MSRNKLSVRLSGALPSSEELRRRLAVAATREFRKGTHLPRGRVQSTDVWILELAKWDSGEGSDTVRTQVEIQKAVRTLEQLASALASLSRSDGKAELYLSTVRYEDMGGFDFPAELVSAAAAGHLALTISITVVLDDDEEDEESSE